MSKQVVNRRESTSTSREPRRSWQQKVFIVLSVLLIISWIAALIVSL
jgi:hypothetical protein